MKRLFLATLLVAVTGAAKAQKTEKQLIDEEARYRYELKDTQKADSLHSLIVKTFPNGWTVRRDAFSEAFNHKEDYHEYIISCLKKYPMEESAKLPEYQEFVYYNAIRSFASDYCSGKYDQQEFIDLMPGMDFKTLAEVYRTTCYVFHLKKAVSDDILLPLATPLIAEMSKKLTDGTYCEEGYRTKEQSDSVARHLLDISLGSYADILLSKGQPAEALQQISLITPERRYQTPEVNETHVKALQQTNQNQLVPETMKLSFQANAVTPAMMDMVRADYVQRHGNDQGFDQYLSTLRSENEVAAMKAEISKQLIKEPYKPFRLKDMQGKEVSSADWQGKIVVLDFWASWCYPCKSAFPGMQMAVDRFKNDSNVLFYFIDTMENADGYEQKARDYMQENGFTFQVLFDTKADASKPGKNQVVFSQMNDINHSMAIPRKMILKDGFVRLTQEGYGGSPSRLADEITYAVEMLKAE